MTGPRGEGATTPDLPDDLREMLASSSAHAAALTEAHRRAWRHGEEETWDFNQDDGALKFQFADGTLAACPAQIIGTLDTRAGTWMWSWCNRSIDPNLTADAESIRAFGEARGFAVLTEPVFRCDEELGWQLTALALALCARQGLYRGPAGPSTFVYFTFGDVSLVGPTGSLPAVEGPG
jgi:hypothetical protein